MNGSEPAIEAPPGALRRRLLVAAGLVLAALAFTVGLVAVLSRLASPQPAPLPVLGKLPEFRLVDSRERAFGSAELRDRAWVAHFFFTRCVTICPRLVASVGRLDQRYREAGIDAVHLVGISVDPEHDTPERLRDYERDHGIDPQRWPLLTGDPEVIESLVVDGFHTAMGEPMPIGDDLIDITHSAKLVLVDGEGRIRGYYDSDEAGRELLFRDSTALLAGRAAAP